MRTEYGKMIRGEPYNAMSAELVAGRARRLWMRLNAAEDVAERELVLGELLRRMGPGVTVAHRFP